MNNGRSSRALEGHPHGGHMTEIDPGRSGAACSHMHRLGLAATVSERREQMDEVWRCRDQAGGGERLEVGGGREEREPCRCTTRAASLPPKTEVRLYSYGESRGYTPATTTLVTPLTNETHPPANHLGLVVARQNKSHGPDL